MPRLRADAVETDSCEESLDEMSTSGNHFYVGPDMEEIEAEVIEEVVDETPSREAPQSKQEKGSSRREESG